MCECSCPNKNGKVAPHITGSSLMSPHRNTRSLTYEAPHSRKSVLTSPKFYETFLEWKHFISTANRGICPHVVQRDTWLPKTSPFISHNYENTPWGKPADLSWNYWESFYCSWELQNHMFNNFPTTIWNNRRNQNKSLVYSWALMLWPKAQVPTMYLHQQQQSQGRHLKGIYCWSKSYFIHNSISLVPFLFM